MQGGQASLSSLTHPVQHHSPGAFALRKFTLLLPFPLLLAWMQIEVQGSTQEGCKMVVHGAHINYICVCGPTEAFAAPCVHHLVMVPSMRLMSTCAT